MMTVSVSGKERYLDATTDHIALGNTSEIDINTGYT
jgi:hypothetical protein